MAWTAAVCAEPPSVLRWRSEFGVTNSGCVEFVRLEVLIFHRCCSLSAISQPTRTRVTCSITYETPLAVRVPFFSSSCFFQVANIVESKRVQRFVRWLLDATLDRFATAMHDEATQDDAIIIEEPAKALRETTTTTPR